MDFTNAARALSTPQNQFVATPRSMPPDQLAALQSNYVVSFVYKCAASELRSPPYVPIQEPLRVEPFCPASTNSIKTFFEAYLENLRFSIAEAEVIRTGFAQYVKKGPSGRLYWQGVRLVGVLLYSRQDTHPAFNEPTLHVGFWGYQRGRVTCDEARAIKADWFAALHRAAVRGEPLSLQVSPGNARGLHFAQKAGFQLHGYRLRK